MTWTISGISGNGIISLSLDAGGVLNDASCARDCGTLSDSVPVTSGCCADIVSLYFEMVCSADYGESCSIADGMSLTLSSGLSYTSAFPGFLKGAAIPEPTTWTLCGVGLLGLVLAHRRFRPTSPKWSTPGSRPSFAWLASVRVTGFFLRRTA